MHYVTLYRFNLLYNQSHEPVFFLMKGQGMGNQSFTLMACSRPVASGVSSHFGYWVQAIVACIMLTLEKHR